jgi:hypothetical protein
MSPHRSPDQRNQIAQFIVALERRPRHVPEMGPTATVPSK